MSKGTEPTRVLQIITRLNVGGATRHVLKLHDHLLRRGFDSTIVWGTESPAEGVIPPPGTEHVKVAPMQRSIHPVKDARAYAALGRIIREKRPHVVHTHMAKAGAIGRIAASRAGVPAIVHTYHGHVLEGYFSEPRSRAFLAAERALARRTTALVAVSPQIKDELVALGIGRIDQWRAMPLSLDLDELLAARVDRETARRGLSLPAEPVLVAIVGRLAPIKRVDLFLQAAAIVAGDFPSVEFVIAGDGEERERLERMGRELLGSRVHFLGWVQDLAALYAAIDVAALTSRNEGTPVALIEAGVVGVPAVATRVGGVPDVVTNNHTGIVVDSDEPREIAAGIARLVREEDVRRRLGDEARRVMTTTYATDDPANAVIELYRSLLDRPRS